VIEVFYKGESMFTELMPLIEQRPVTITVAVLSGSQRIRVNVVPKSLEKDGQINDKIGYSNKDKIAKVPEDAVKALTTPLSLTGTAEEIDAELAQALREFAESHVQLQKTVDQAKEQIAEAVKAIEERDKNKAKVKTAARPTTVGEDANVGKAGSSNPSLFDLAAATASKDDSKADSEMDVCAEQLKQS
jgi:PRTRC genetic system protein E